MAFGARETILPAVLVSVGLFHPAEWASVRHPEVFRDLSGWQSSEPWTVGHLVVRTQTDVDVDSGPLSRAGNHRLGLVYVSSANPTRDGCRYVRTL